MDSAPFFVPSDPFHRWDGETGSVLVLPEGCPRVGIQEAPTRMDAHRASVTGAAKEFALLCRKWRVKKSNPSVPSHWKSIRGSATPFHRKSR